MVKIKEMSKKGEILIIAPSLPKFDFQSGCLRLFTIIKILSKKFDVVFYAATTLGECDKRYFDELEKLNVQIYTKETNFKEIFEQHHFLFAFLEFYHIAEYYLPRIRLLQRDCFIITDSVDVHFYREKLKYDLTQDLKVEKDWLKNVIRVAESSKETGMVSPAHYNYEGSDIDKVFEGSLNGTTYYFKGTGESHAQEMYFTDFVMGASLLIKRSISKNWFI